MITDLSQLDFTKKYTYKDYLTWNLQERVELIKGYIHRMAAAPARNHQKISGKIFRAFSTFLDNKNCEVYYAPFEVRFYDLSDPGKAITNVVEPDISVICNEEKLDERGCLGAPDLVVEILAPATSEKDLIYKYDLYESQGVKEYWVVSPTEKTLMIYSQKESGSYQPSRLFVRGDVIKSDVLDGFVLDLSDVFEAFDWEAHDKTEKYYNRV